jgi:poly(3-hydroxybutyrate) depolymerase
MARLAARSALALALLAAAHSEQVATGAPVVGLRAWVNDEAIAMVENAVRPVRPLDTLALAALQRTSAGCA